MAFVIGNGGKIQKSGTDINMTEWSMEKTVRTTDATHSGTAGWALWKGTVKEASGTGKAFWDAAQLVETTLGMDIGSEVTLLLFVGNVTQSGNKKFTAPALIEKLSYQVNNQSGLVTYDFSWKSQGPVTGPA